MEVLAEHHAVWQTKPVLRALYTDYYRRIVAQARPGRTLEIGGGIGNLKAFMQDIVTTDIQHAPWLDAVADAQRLPFADAAFANIVMFDVLHHIERPRRFLAEVDRLLVPGGRLIVMEPEMTPVSRLVYGLFHPEPIDMRADPLEDGGLSPGRDPYSANQAIPHLLFARQPARVEKLFPTLRVVRYERLGLFAYPLSGGFRRWCLVPQAVLPALLGAEARLMPLLGRVMAFRMLGVLERR